MISWKAEVLFDTIRERTAGGGANTLDFNYLRNVPVFEDLRAEELAIINRVTREYRYKKNETVFREGEAGEGFHYVKTGKV